MKHILSISTGPMMGMRKFHRLRCKGKNLREAKTSPHRYFSSRLTKTIDSHFWKTVNLVDITLVDSMILQYLRFCLSLLGAVVWRKRQSHSCPDKKKC